MKKLKVLVVHPNAVSHVIEIAHDLASMQKVVGGLVECINLSNGCDLWCNEEFLYNGSEQNRYVPEIEGFIYGTFFITGPCDKEGNTTSISDDQAKFWEEFFG